MDNENSKGVQEEIPKKRSGLQKLKLILGFLTRLPVKIDFESYDDIAAIMWLFPFAGFISGVICGILGILLFSLLPEFLAGFILLGCLIWITGAHHTDGLLDFGDGLMVMGSAEKKRKVMHDVSIGAGGFSLGMLVLIISGIALSYSFSYIFMCVILCEITSKYSMVVACSLEKKSISPTAEPFIRLNTKKSLIFSTILSIVLIILAYFLFEYCIQYPIQQYIPYFQSAILFDITLIHSLIIFAIGALLSTIIVIILSRKHFEGITGDCLGALHEITRMFIPILIIILIAS
jgi:adenosylcobinamide-GDP ribazoletransferase